MDAIDNVLSKEEEIVPSSGFLASVMDRVREEALAPPPIPFPWMRFLPGLVLALAVLGWAAFELIRYVAQSTVSFSLPELHFTASLNRTLKQAGWIAVAVALSLGSWLFSRRLTGRRGLL